jgi:hypothetical protein
MLAVTADDAGVVLRGFLGRGRDGDLGTALDDVAVGHDDAVLPDDEPGPNALALLDVAELVGLEHVGGDVHDGGQRIVDDRLDGLGLGRWRVREEVGRVARGLPGQVDGAGGRDDREHHEPRKDLAHARTSVGCPDGYKRGFDASGEAVLARPDAWYALPVTVP